MKRILMAATLLCAASAALADKALVIGAPSRDGNFFGTAGSYDLPEALREAGFSIVGASPASAELMRQGLSEFFDGAWKEPRLLIVLTGPFARSERDVWLLSDAALADGKLPDLAQVAGVGLSVNTVLEIASRVPGGAVVLLAEQGRPEKLGAGLRPGHRGLEPPQGVTLIRGKSSAVAAFLTGELLVPGRSLKEAVEAGGDLAVSGFVSSAVEFVPERRTRPPGPAADPVRPGAADQVERAIWQATQAQDSREAYLGYLQRYPLGRFAPEARKALAAIEAEPFREARLAEEKLELKRSEVRQVQQWLTVLDYRPRGVDGLMGPGTRAAIRRFQAKSGFPQSSYLTVRQIQRLKAQAERRVAELEAEAERKRLELERLDRGYWEATGAGRDEAALRTYLKRYPDGIFSEEATVRLVAIEREKRVAAEAKDRAAWDVAKADGRIRAFREYLRLFPKGAFAAEANARIAALSEERSDASQSAQAEEKALGLNPVTRLLIEKRLEALGLEPGKVDGQFDRNTRRAIRRFQQARDLKVTGYLNRAATARMLADAGIKITR